MAEALEGTPATLETSDSFGTLTDAQMGWVNRMLDLTRDSRLTDALSGDPEKLERAKEHVRWVFRMARWVRR